MYKYVGYGKWKEITKPSLPYIVAEVSHKEVSRNPLSQRFHDILHELGELHDRKQQDYGREADPFANVRGTTEWGVPAWVGAMVRANDKVKRLQNLATKGSLSNEAAEDSFKDLAVYAIIGLCLFEEERDG